MSIEEARAALAKGGAVMVVCSYCRVARAVHSDHIVPVALRRRHRECARCGHENEHFPVAGCSFDVGRRVAEASRFCTCKHYKSWDDVKVPACGNCNWRKGTRRLVPMDYEPFDSLPGTRPWQRWSGEPMGAEKVLR